MASDDEYTPPPVDGSAAIQESVDTPPDAVIPTVDPPADNPVLPDIPVTVLNEIPTGLNLPPRASFPRPTRVRPPTPYNMDFGDTYYTPPQITPLPAIPKFTGKNFRS